MKKGNTYGDEWGSKYQKKWTDTNLQEFAEWCSKSWEYDYHTKIWENYHTKETKTTSDLRKQWKMEMEKNS